MDRDERWRPGAETDLRRGAAVGSVTGRTAYGATLPLALALLLLLAAVPGVAAAERRAGANVVVGADERVSGDLTATGGTVIVRGVVDGDLDAYGGTVLVTGAVTGRLDAYGGTVRIAGAVGGNAATYGGTVVVAPNGSVGRSLGVAAGDAVVAGTVRGHVVAGAGRLALAPTAHVGGDVQYDGELARADGSRVDGRIKRVRDVAFGPAPPVPSGTLVVYGLLSNLLFGALLLYGLSDLSAAVAENAVLDPGRSLLVGAAGALAVPVLVAALAATVVGLPAAVAAALAVPLLVWAAGVYGRLAVGGWLLSMAGVERSGAALVAGVLVVGLVAGAPGLVGVPLAGVAVHAAVGVLGGGALVVELRARLGRQGRY